MSIPLEIPQSNTERNGPDRTGMGRIALADGTMMAYRDGMTKTVTATGFDTLTYARRLKAAGVDEAPRPKRTPKPSATP